jgi:hypothetical protein
MMRSFGSQARLLLVAGFVVQMLVCFASNGFAVECSEGAKGKLRWSYAELTNRFGQHIYGFGDAESETFTELDDGQSVLIYSVACSKMNHSGIKIEAGESYAVELVASGRWGDKNLPADPEIGVFSVNFLMKLFTPLRRDADHNWMVLLGGSGNDKQLVPVATNDPLIPGATGEFVTYANDAKWFYGNNTGEAVLRLTKVKRN